VVCCPAVNVRAFGVTMPKTRVDDNTTWAAIAKLAFIILPVCKWFIWL